MHWLFRYELFQNWYQKHKLCIPEDSIVSPHHTQISQNIYTALLICKGCTYPWILMKCSKFLWISSELQFECNNSFVCAVMLVGMPTNICRIVYLSNLGNYNAWLSVADSSTLLRNPSSSVFKKYWRNVFVFKNCSC